ncbi:creatininase family protein [Cohnella soli]|uniref:Creatininase family protein n=1 Tax=Cohnella soli TaxID=425005 RepID=A0ABW0HVR6_9BACL
MKPNTGVKTLWSELLPYEFKRRLAKFPLVYLPLGLCEPHGQVSAFGLDTIKAEWLCRQAAERIGGIVAPSMGYHIHESGNHAKWLEETIGEENPHMTSVPPAIFLHFFLYQLRAFVNAGFRKIVVLTGHGGGNQKDIRLAAEKFMERVPVKIWVRSDPELVEGIYDGDHAGKYEISQLMYIRPDLVDMGALHYEDVPGSGGRLALGTDADEASPMLGGQIMQASLDRLCMEARQLKDQAVSTSIPRIPYYTVEMIWSEVLRHIADWVTSNPGHEQREVSLTSQWKIYEQYRPMSTI